MGTLAPCEKSLDTLPLSKTVRLAEKSAAGGQPAHTQAERRQPVIIFVSWQMTGNKHI